MSRTRALAASAAVVVSFGLGLAGVKLWQQAAPGAPQPAAVPASEASAPAPTPARVARIARWEVRYEDANLGQVEGTALVDWAKDVAVVRFTTANGTPSITRADDLSVDDDQGFVTMRLRGMAPGDTPTKAALPAGIRTIEASSDESFTVPEADPPFSATVEDRAAADNDGVRLGLRAAAYGSLKGEWSYAANPLTKRNASGGGRVGLFRLLNDDELENPRDGFIGIQTGREDWWPVPAHVTATIVMEDQLAAKQTRAVYPYPFDAKGAPVGGDPAATRTLFVVGTNFPVDGGRALQNVLPQQPDDHIKAYRLLGVSTDPDLDPKMRERLEDGWRKMTPYLTDAEKKDVRRLDAALIQVTLEPGVLPGVKKFGWEEGRGGWFLQFGGDTADASFVRPITFQTANDATSRDTFEPTATVFLPEQLNVEIRTRTELPLDVIPVRVTASGAPSAPLVLKATRQPGSPTLYRTDPFKIAKGGTPGAGQLALHSGDHLDATVLMDDVAFIAQPGARAAVLVTPDEVTPNRVAGDPTQVKLWKDALRFAADADGVPDDKKNDLSTLPSVSIRSAEYHGLTPTVGDHAAMLLLRSTFLDQLRERVKMLDGIKTDDQVEAFREWVKPLMEPPDLGPPKSEPPIGWDRYPYLPLAAIDEVRQWKDWVLSQPYGLAKKGIEAGLKALDSRPTSGFGKGTYFGDLGVPGPGGGTWEYFRTYWDDSDGAFEPFFHGSRLEVRDWRLKATRAVIAQYRDAISGTIDETAAVKTGDVDGLLKITGLDFSPVVRRVLPQLMRLEAGPGTQQWIPDRVARAAVANLYVYGAAVRAEESYSRLQMASAVSLVGDTLALSGVTGVTVVSEAFEAEAVDGVLEWQLAHAIRERLESAQQVDFQFGASSVIGADRLDEAYAESHALYALVSDLAVQWGLDPVFGEIKEAVLDSVGPSEKTSAAWLETWSATLHAAGPSPHEPAPQIHSTRRRLLDALRRLGADERLIERVSRLSPSEAKALPKPDARAFLRMAAEGGARVEDGRAASREEVQAVFEARRLREDIAAPHDETEAVTRISYGDAPGAARRPAPPRPTSAMAVGRELPLTGAPARDQSWIRIVEKGGDTVYYQSDRVDASGKRETLGNGKSSDVFPIKRVEGRGTGRLFEGDGSVIKILKDSEMGTAREQVLRMKEAWQVLQRVRGDVPLAEILEFHEDATPPYVIQRKIIADGERVRVIKARELMAEVKKPPFPVPSVGFPLPPERIAELFPPALQRAVVELHFKLAAAGLISWDLSLPNLYFESAGGTWRAGILDIDHVVDIKKPGPVEHKTWAEIRSIRDRNAEAIPSLEADGRLLYNAYTFMEKALELETGGNYSVPYIKYKAPEPQAGAAGTGGAPAARPSRPGVFVQSLIDPAIVANVFRNRFKLYPRPPEPTPPVPPKGR